MLHRKYYHGRSILVQAKSLMVLAVEPWYWKKEEAEAKS
jgi:hypothetical protein